MTEVKTIGDYINALPDDIRGEVKELTEEELKMSIEDFKFRHAPRAGLAMFTLDFWCKKAYKYTLTEKDGKYYTNW